MFRKNENPIYPSDSKLDKHTSVFFQQTVDPKKVDHLLQLVAYGKRSEVETLLNQNPDLLRYKGQVTDYSGRTFQNISPLHLAFWYKDTYMWKILRKHLDLKFPGEFEKQLKEFHKMERENRGIEYTHNNQIKHSMNYDIKEFTTTLMHVLNVPEWQKESTNDINDELIESKAWDSIGIVEKNVPVHITHEYCNPNAQDWASSKSTLNFKYDEKRALPEVQSISIDSNHNDRGFFPDNTSISWFPINPDLGSKFVFLPSNEDCRLWSTKGEFAFYYCPWNANSRIEKFVSTLETLWNARTKEIENLIAEFKLEKTFASGIKEWCSIM